MLRIIQFPLIFSDYIKFINRNNNRFILKFRDVYPRVLDKTTKTTFDRHYVYHTAWAARKLQYLKPSKHIDISSSLYFSAIVSAFIPIDFYDYRPADLSLSKLHSKSCDLMSLPFSNNSIESISCMHTIEHIGLGRYGDTIDPEGDTKAINELKRVVAKNGSLLFVVPVGIPKIEFNAHRIYSYGQIKEHFQDMTLHEFTLITDNGEFIENAKPDLVKTQKYGCGCFWFIK